MPVSQDGYLKVAITRDVMRELRIINGLDRAATGERVTMSQTLQHLINAWRLTTARTMERGMTGNGS
jgi:hypothetical protein